MSFFSRKPKLYRLGDLVAVDPSQITALYVDEGLLVIRYGLAVIKLRACDLHASIADTFEFLFKMRNVR